MQFLPSHGGNSQIESLIEISKGATTCSLIRIVPGGHFLDAHRKQSAQRSLALRRKDLGFGDHVHGKTEG
jgi:hypothetical protein